MKPKTLLSFIGVACLLAVAMSIPASSLAMPVNGSISGTITYAGSHDTNHEVLVAAHPVPDSTPLADVHIWGPGNYSLIGLPNGSYYISAFLDIYDRGEGPPEFGEPLGWYDPNSDGNPDPMVVNDGNLTGIDIAMQDIDSEYIQGTACYLGGVYGPGPIEVGLHVNPADAPVVARSISRPCEEFLFSGGPAGTYYASLFYDVNASGGPPEPGEPFGWHDADKDGNPDPIIYTGNVITGVNITLGGILHVDFSASGTGDGSSWNNAFPDLQDALAAAESGEEIWVASGMYTPGTTRDSSFVLKHGVAVYGGFNGTEAYRFQRNWRANTTVLSGEIGDFSTKLDNTYHVVMTASTYEHPVDETTILDGFTIMGGYANVDANQMEKGGGLLNSYGHPTLVNLNFIDNYALNHGGAIASQYNSEPLVIVNSTFSGNGATNNAGGIGNLSEIVVINSSLIGNTGGNGGGIVNLSGAHAEVYNSILWNNQGDEIALQGTATASVSYSIVDGNFIGGSNILTMDPLFVDADGPDNLFGTLDDDLHLQAGSPAIDAGDNYHVVSDLADSNGNGNISEFVPLDMDGGARHVDDLAAPNTGNGIAPFVDLGADEYATPVAINGVRIASSMDPTLLGEATIFAARIITGTHASWSWDFDDGTLASGPLPKHTFEEPGLYSVALTAANSLGMQQASGLVTVYELLPVNPGSSVSTTDGKLTINIPSSITGTVTISYTPQPAPSSIPGIYEFADQAFELQATDGEGLPITELSQPITLTVRYDQTIFPVGTDESTLNLQRYDTGSGSWVGLTVLSRDLANDTISVLLDHFSEFALFIEPAGTGQKLFLPIIQH